MLIPRWLTGSLIALTLQGCSATFGEPDEDADSGAEPAPKGSACAAYKLAFCRYSEECALRSGTKADCQDFVDDIPCESERLARECSDALPSAKCLEPPDRCDLLDVLDRSDATAACERFSEGICRNEEDCGTHYASCRQQIAPVLPCENVVRLDRDPASCFEAVARASCDMELGSVCEDLFIYP